LATLAWLACGLTALGQAHKTGEVRIVANLIDRLPDAKAQHAADISISINGKSLDQVHQPTTQNPGWWHPKNTTRTYITTPPQKGQGLLEISLQ
jgi:hypothetical protein